LITITDIQEDHINGFRAALDSVAKEKKYLMWTEAPPLESTREFVLNNIKQGIPQVVALDNRRVIGWCDIIPHPQPATRHVGRLGMGLKNDYRHKGIGTLLMQEALSRAKQYGLERIELEVFESNEAAIKLYKKFHFKLEGKRTAAVKIDGAYINCLMMSLFLDAGGVDRETWK
jgi:RimJ/RimL family protein N-acetyltransferase